MYCLLVDARTERTIIGNPQPAQLLWPGTSFLSCNFSANCFGTSTSTSGINS